MDSAGPPLSGESSYPQSTPCCRILSVRPFPGILGNSRLVDASVQVDDDVDSCDEDLGGDEDDDCISGLAHLVSTSKSGMDGQG